MIKVLILAFDFPPLLSAGAQRPYSWYKYFNEFGIYPVVITRQWDENSDGITGFVKPSATSETIIDVDSNGTVIRVPYTPNFRDKIILKYGENKFRVIRKFLSFLLSFLKFYFRFFDNSKAIYSAADNYLKSNNCAVILATGEPFILFRHAWSLGKKYTIPYILDYRDGWTTGLDLDLDNKSFKTINTFLFSRLERKYLKKAALASVASQQYITKLKKKYPGPEYVEILNGYYEEAFVSKEKAREINVFDIIYSGKLYDFQPLEEWLEALIETQKKFSSLSIKLKFIGGEKDEKIKTRLNKYAERLNFDVELLPRLKYEDYALELINAKLLLLLSDHTTEWLNAKLFDYLPSLTPVLLFKSVNTGMAAIIEDCKAGYCCKNREELLQTLNVLMEEYISYSQLSCHSHGFEKYSRRLQVQKLSKYISLCVE